MTRSIRPYQSRASIDNHGPLNHVQPPYFSSPSIHHLPNELLARIFKMFCRSKGFTGALIISAVCRLWRNSASAYPAMWSSLRIDLDHEDHRKEEYKSDPKERDELKKKEENLVAAVKLYLVRTKELPLDLDITPVSWTCGEHPAFDLLVSQSTRWRSLVFRGRARDLRWLSLPRLEMVGFAERSSQDRQYPPFAASFNDAPKLTNLMLNAIEVDFTILGSFFKSWGRLRSLSYGTKHSSLTTLWSVLDMCSQLSHLALHCTDSISTREDEFSECSPPKTLATITSFSVTFQTGKLLDCVFSSLTLPNVNELAVEQDNSPTRCLRARDLGSVIAFMDRSQCRRLTSLKLRDVRVAGEWIVSALLRVPSLQELSITDSFSPTKDTFHPISAKLMQWLHASTRDLSKLEWPLESGPLGIWSSDRRPQIPKRIDLGPLVPNLRRLTLKTLTTKERYFYNWNFDYVPVFDPVAFIETITSRWLPDEPSEYGVVCLKSVELHLPEGDVPDLYASLARFDAAGMQVVVKCDGR